MILLDVLGVLSLSLTHDVVDLREHAEGQFLGIIFEGGLVLFLG